MDIVLFTFRVQIYIYEKVILPFESSEQSQIMGLNVVQFEKFQCATYPPVLSVNLA